MALAILGLLAIGTFDVIRNGLWRVKRWSDDAATQGDQRVALALLARDIRCAYLSSDEEHTYFAGTPPTGSYNNRIDFSRRAAGDDAADDPVWEVGYFLQPGRAPGTWDLCRRWQPELDASAMTGGSTRPLLADVRALRFEYFDGNRWSTEWNWDHERQAPMTGIRGLPVLVRVLLHTADNPHEQAWTIPVMCSVLNRSIHAI
jgi:hypothetical protein